MRGERPVRDKPNRRSGYNRKTLPLRVFTVDSLIIRLIVFSSNSNGSGLSGYLRQDWSLPFKRETKGRISGVKTKGRESC